MTTTSQPGGRSLLSDRDLLARLVAFDSISGRSNLAIADMICDYLDRPGVRVERNPSPEGDRVNLVVIAGPEVDGGERAGLVLSGHLDVVPAEEPGWHSDPFELTDAEAGLVGRGACDMKGFVALAINAVARVDRARLRHPLALVLTYDEEIGTLGARRFVETWPPDRPLPRRTIVGEPTSLRAVRMHKGHVGLRIEVCGQAAHSGYPHLGESAIEPAARVVSALADLRRRLAEEPCPNGEHFAEVPYVALNVGTIHGGKAVNVVPDRCVIEAGFRILPGMDPEPVLERVMSAVAEALGDAPYRFEGEDRVPCFLLEEDNDLYRDFCRLLGQSETLSASYGTDAGWLQQGGFDCLVWGPGSIEVAHRANEVMPRDEFARGGELLGRVVERFCGAG